MLALLANGGPPLYPTSDTPALEWVVWGVCMSAAALLGGWGLLNRNHPERDVRVGVSLLAAMVLVGFATVFVIQREWDREQERGRREWQERIERLEREYRESQR